MYMTLNEKDDIKFGKVFFLGTRTNENQMETSFALDTSLPFKIGEIHRISPSEKAVMPGFIFENHYHTRDSDRYEFFVAVGECKIPLFRVRYCVRPFVSKESVMYAGDTCLVPPELSHAFICLKIGAELWRFSNLHYFCEHQKPQSLFLQD